MAAAAAIVGWAPELKPAPVIAVLDARLRALAARKRVTFVDDGQVIAAPDGAIGDERSLDGVHPNTRGYRAMEVLSRRAIATAMRPPG